MSCTNDSMLKENTDIISTTSRHNFPLGVVDRHRHVKYNHLQRPHQIKTLSVSNLGLSAALVCLL